MFAFLRKFFKIGETPSIETALELTFPGRFSVREDELGGMLVELDGMRFHVQDIEAGLRVSDLGMFAGAYENRARVIDVLQDVSRDVPCTFVSEKSGAIYTLTSPENIGKDIRRLMTAIGIAADRLEGEERKEEQARKENCR